MPMRGPLIIVSGPSGVGKSTVVQKLLPECRKPVHVSVSATTRDPRPGERDGVHYHFWTEERFLKEVEAEAMLEWAFVHNRAYYGTPLFEVEPFRERGDGVILVIDVQGTQKVRLRCPDAYTIFLHAPREVLEERLRTRKSEDEAAIANRLRTASEELAVAHEYHALVENDDLAKTVHTLRTLIEDRFSQES